MDKETSSRVSSIAAQLMGQLRKFPGATNFAITREDAEALAGSCLSQDETPGQAKATHVIHPAPAEFSNAQVALDPILHFFHYAHLPTVLQRTSRLFFILASEVVHTIPRNAERTVALRKLLEAKDAAVRANLPAPSFGEKPFVASEQPIGEAREIGGHDLDRDGPVPFGD